MADQISYWVCACGKANLNGTKICAGCGAHKPWRHLMIYGVAGTLGVAIVIALSITPTPTIEGPKTQKAFEETVRSVRQEIGRAPNAVLQHELITRRDANLDPVVSDWIGTVRGVSLMTNGAALEVSIGDATFVSGVWIGAQLDTTIPTSGRLYSITQTLKVGDIVRISGSVQKYAEHLAEISYSDNNSAEHPRYIFRYTSVDKL